MTVPTCANAGIGAADKALGNKEGWSEFEFKSPDQGVATTVFAAFSPDLKGASPIPCCDYSQAVQDAS